MVRGVLVKEIQGFDYFIDEDGDISHISEFDYCEKEISVRIGRGGYPTVRLCKNGAVFTFYLHRLVASTFVTNSENKPFVNHLDGNKLNPERWNLEWSTHSENINHCV